MSHLSHLSHSYFPCPCRPNLVANVVDPRGINLPLVRDLTKVWGLNGMRLDSLNCRLDAGRNILVSGLPFSTDIHDSTFQVPDDAFIVMSPFWNLGANMEKFAMLLDRHMQVWARCT